jgi:hypothetical protein
MKKLFLFVVVSAIQWQGKLRRAILKGGDLFRWQGIRAMGF